MADSCLKCRKQVVKIDDTDSVFQILLSGIPQGSILGPILFNILTMTLCSLLKIINLHILRITIQYMQ